ncbi:MAG TPA: biotin/lipoyl-binding protein, partial [Pyrinomonadaceae bacterium]|nr:biotin/lipoyl-binding protein [Pyrinomonadaceae bacterium]
MRTKISVLLTISAIAIGLAGCGKKEEPAKTAPAAEIQNVTIAKVTKSSMEDFYEATGTVKAAKTTDIAANMMGRIVALPVSEGDTVTRGQTLVEIDNRESQTQRQRAEAGLKEAQAALIEIDKSVIAANAGVKSAEENKAIAEKTYARIKELYERRSASAQEFDEAQS